MVFGAVVVLPGAPVVVSGAVVVVEGAAVVVSGAAVVSTIHKNRLHFSRLLLTLTHLWVCDTLVLPNDWL